jgi:hypothetical protein
MRSDRPLDGSTKKKAKNGRPLNPVEANGSCFPIPTRKKASRCVALLFRILTVEVGLLW